MLVVYKLHNSPWHLLYTNGNSVIIYLKFQVFLFIKWKSLVSLTSSVNSFIQVWNNLSALYTKLTDFLGDQFFNLVYKNSQHFYQGRCHMWHSCIRSRRSCHHYSCQNPSTVFPHCHRCISSEPFWSMLSVRPLWRNHPRLHRSYPQFYWKVAQKSKNIRAEINYKSVSSLNHLFHTETTNSQWKVMTSGHLDVEIHC